MMHFDILTLFPEIFPGVLETSILGRAVQKKLLSFNYVNIRDFTTDIHNKVDDYPYGGGCGMLMQAQPIYDAYQSVVKNKPKPLTVYLSPRGKVFNQEVAKEMVKHEHIVLLCGHYEGVDQRVIDEISDFELSIGDYVLTGGELGAMVVCDAVSRLVPGVLSEEAGFTGESHYNQLLEYPQYTRPAVWRGRNVPEVLRNGNQKDIDAWRKEQSLILTESARPDIFYNTPHLPYAVRNSISKDYKFKLFGFSADINSDTVFKEKRKLYQKLQKKGFAVQDVFKVYSDFNKLQTELSKCEKAIVLSDVAFDAVITLSRPMMWISSESDKNSLYPYKISQSEDSVIDEILTFLSISEIISKFSK